MEWKQKLTTIQVRTIFWRLTKFSSFLLTWPPCTVLTKLLIRSRETHILDLLDLRGFDPAHCHLQNCIPSWPHSPQRITVISMFGCYKYKRRHRLTITMVIDQGHMSAVPMSSSPHAQRYYWYKLSSREVWKNIDNIISRTQARILNIIYFTKFKTILSPEFKWLKTWCTTTGPITIVVTVCFNAWMLQVQM